MKNIKNIKTVFKILLLLLVVSSCEEDDYVAPNEFVNAGFTTDFGPAVKELNVFEYTAFMDISEGATYHEWRIPESACFLKGPIPNSTRNYDKFIINEGSTVTTDRTALVLFKEGNTSTKVTLYNEFDEYTEFILPVRDSISKTQVIDTIRTIFKDNKWIYEQTIWLDVYDTIVPDMAMRDVLGNNIDFKNLTTIDLKFEDKLVFEDLSETTNNARPTSTKWRIHTIEENEEDEINLFSGETKIDTITFNKRIGSFKGKLISKRDRTETVNGDEDTYEIPVIFNVTALDEPFIQNGDIIERADNTIVIPLSSIVADPGSSQAAFFTVNVNGSPAAITSVVKSNTTGDFLLITLENEIFETDTVTVSYDGNGAFKSLDDRPLQAFTDVPVITYVIVPTVQTGNVVELRDETIQIPFDAPFDGDTFTGDTTQGFEVLVNGVNFVISSVNLDIDNTKLNIRLVDKIYRPDVITVSYDGSGSINAVGGGIITPFSLVPVIMDNGDILNGEGSFNDPSKWVNAGNGTSTITFVTASVPNSPDTGTVAFVEAPDGNKPDLRSTDTYPFEVGKTYVWTAKRYIFPEHTTTFAKPYLDIQLSNENYNGAARGVWEDVIITEFTQAATGNFNVRLQPIPPGICKVYYDDMIIAEKEVRP
ncbi:SwmB domain-containing protein [Flavivirga rizhaonensis]|uniref:Uncharacterized protein n=1 Tax=Flavivirga rizhaonensis TaxID=2559571 RepID=A0A4S1DSE0_9FLAO|nr:SwmB domain-containing protein [Flavivirga rizhaonensis]TGV00809.1 hypothetical protein EM932_17950 [Flavivirga rizhaonensis]